MYLNQWYFWVVTGIDYSGKTTVLKYVKEKGFPSLHWSDLREIPWIRPVLERPYDIVFEMGPLSRASFILLVASTMFEVMKKKRIVLVDSYWYRFYVKEKIFGLSDLKILETLFDLPKPIEVFYIEVSPEEALKRSGGKFTQYETFGPNPEDFIKFQTLLDKELRALLNSLNVKLTYLDGSKSISEQGDIIIDHIMKYHVDF